MSEELKIEAIREKYKDVWVVVDVTKHDKYQVPRAGKVLFYDPDKEKVLDAGVNLHKKNPKISPYFFYTGNPFPEDVAVILNAC
jgi:phage pi2 protein 07